MSDLSPTGAPVIALRGASLGYGRVSVVREIDLVVGRGDFLAVLGPNGSGKSTLVKGILRLAQLTGGSLTVFGSPAHRFRQWSRLGYVPQRSVADSPLPASVGEVVTSGRLARKGMLRRLSAGDREAVDRALDLVGLGDHADRSLATLSGGQQRRVLLARALAGEPEVLLLDEPTAGVDLGNQELLAATLSTLRDAGTTVVLVAHELGPMEPLINRVVQMREGSVAYDGTPAGAPAPGADAADPHCDPAPRLSRLGL